MRKLAVAILAVVVTGPSNSAAEMSLPDGFQGSTWCSSPSTGMYQITEDLAPGFQSHQLRDGEFSLYGLKVKSVTYGFAYRLLYRVTVDLDSRDLPDLERIRAVLVAHWGLPVEEVSEITGWMAPRDNMWASKSGEMLAMLFDLPVRTEEKFNRSLVHYRIAFMGAPYLQQRRALIKELQLEFPLDRDSKEKLERLDPRPFTSEQISRWCQRG